MKVFKMVVACIVACVVTCSLCLLGGQKVIAFAEETESENGSSESNALSNIWNLDFETIDKQLAEDVKNYHIPGMAVAVVDKDGALFEKTYGVCDNPERPFIIGSMSKSFTALAIMQLVEQGKVDLDASIDEYINGDEWFAAGTDHKRITVRDLLNQTSGIQTYQAMGKLKSTESYGSHVYANGNYGLLGLIVEAASGMNYEEYVTTYIFEPLKMSQATASLEKAKEKGLLPGYRNYYGIPVAGEPDYPIMHEKGKWTNIPGGYLCASLSDMEKYLQMYLRGGEDIITEQSIQSMFYDNVPDGEGGFYGMGWVYSTESMCMPVLNHAGLVENYTCNMFILPEKEIAIIVMVNMNDYLVGNGLLADVVMPLFGMEKQLGPNEYLKQHLMIDAAVLLLLLISLYPVITLKKWKQKSENKKIFVFDMLRHLVLPAALLVVLPCMGTPLSVVWLFAKDVAIVLYVSAALLFFGGICKCGYLIKRKK